jgi:hypothetical protein
LQQATSQYLNQVTRDEIVAVFQSHGGHQRHDDEGTKYLHV